MKLKETIKEKLAVLSDDMNERLEHNQAVYLVDRVTQILEESLKNGSLKESDLKKIDKTFNSISMGLLECRRLNVVCIMKCLTDSNYGIFQSVTPR